ITRLACHPLTRHDGPVSVMRAYTVEEYTRMVADAEIGTPVTIRRHHWYRVSLTRNKKEGGDA
ncbi:MAG: methyltransferase type 11, partial [Nitrospinota bacterium]